MNAPVPSRGLAPIKARGLEQSGRFVSTGGAGDARVADFLNRVFEDAVIYGASDIHFEMDELDGMEVRLRKSGDLEVFAGSLDSDSSRIAKTKMCAKSKLDDQERLVPQDGRMMVFFGDRRVDIRVAITPTVAGYKIVCRLLDSRNANADIEVLEIPFLVRQTMKRVSSKTEGMVLLSGPTGSGKTTTLYALLKHLKNDSVHIITIENPVEYAVKGFTQIDVDGNLTFAKAMKSALRLDPDVIMVGEIRDDESADIAQKAGTSGHMVLSTVHANSASESITRLLRMKVKPDDAASVLSAVIAQRLVARIDPESELAWEAPNDVEREWLLQRNMYDASMRIPRIVKGGFAGRLPLVEMIEITPPIRRLIEKSGSGTSEAALIPSVVELASRQESFETLAQAGVRSVLEGKTTLEAVMSKLSDVSYVPTRRRWEQILIHQGLLKVEDLERLRREIHAELELGKIISLKHHLINTRVCTMQQVVFAMGLADYQADEVK
jgi:type II secretory ATPase GspE/PulE/Tfp pilus assembly ATPase PilB-like protein